MLLEDIESLADFMTEDYQTVEFVVSMVKAFHRRMRRKRLERFALSYIEMKESDRKLFDRFLRNYGRYDGRKFGIRLKDPNVAQD
ncbi:MAG: Uncharacterized protein XD49_2137 [Caldanaerobacter subterraneus]|nr:MAG: Uncharacterized protein XD49_2137 [Caldanaerobacter subterraneus]